MVLHYPRRHPSQLPKEYVRDASDDDLDAVGSRFHQGKQLAELLNEAPSLMSKRLEIAKRLDLHKVSRNENEAVSWLR